MNKTKFFSSLLVVALVASASLFVSCKDYDDDIKNLQQQIDKTALISDLDALKQTVAANATSAQAAMAKAEEALRAAQAAQTTASAAVTKAQLDEAINAVKKTAEEAGTNAAQALKDAAAAAKTAGDASQAAADAAAAAKAAQETADKAVKDAADAAAAALAAQTTGSAETGAKATATDALSKANDALQKIGDLDKTYVTASSLQQQLTDLKAEITSGEGQGGEESAVSAYKAMIEELYAAVTSVSLYVTGYGRYADNFFEDINFYKVIEKENKFPTDAEIAAGQYTADKQYTFTEGKNITGADSIYIRVSPSTAKLDASMISLVNSQGDALSSDLVVVDRVEPFTGLITRAGADNNGLWKVVFKTKDGYNDDAFKAATKNLKVAGAPQIAFAVAINNTKDNAADRRIVSEYNVTVETPYANHAQDFYVTVGEDTYWINNLHNRYLYTETRTGDYSNYAVPTHTIPELSWIGDCQTKVIISDPAAATDNAVNRNGTDNRQRGRILYVDVNEDIEIEYSNRQTPLKGFYVTLDKDFAIESSPSEINAWNSYSYTNVGTKTTKAKMFDGNKGVIQINDADAKGDYIGFRVYAVNLDGTLVDPDGRAFYVHVGKLNEETQTSTADVLANQVSPTSELTKDVLNFMTVEDNVGYRWEIVNKDSEFPTGVRPSIQLGYADKDGNVNSWSGFFNNSYSYFYDRSANKSVSIVARFQNIAQLYDGQSITIKGTPYKYVTTDQQSQYQLIEGAEITVTITKQMPVFPVELQGRAQQFKDAQTAAQQFFFDGTAKLYLLETANKYELTDWTPSRTTPLAQGEIDLHGLFYNEGLDAARTATYDPANLTFTFANAAVDPSDATKTIDVEVTKASTGSAGTAWVFTLPSKLIDNGKHDGKATYVYPGVSTYKKNNNVYYAQDYPVEKNFSAYYLDLWSKDIKVFNTNACMTFDFTAKALTWDTNDAYKIENVKTKNGYINPIYGSSTTTTNKNLSNLIGYYKVLTAADGAKYKPVLISNSTQKVDYFNVTWNAGAKQFDFTKIDGVENPQNDVPSTLKFWMRDPFGNDLEFAISDKFTVKKKATAAPRF